MNKEEIKVALERLEQKLHNINGYDTHEILAEMKIPVNDSNEKELRKNLRELICKRLYPDFRTAGEWDIVYPPHGKNGGVYRLSKYRGK